MKRYTVEKQAGEGKCAGILRTARRFTVCGARHRVATGAYGVVLKCYDKVRARRLAAPPRRRPRAALCRSNVLLAFSPQEERCYVAIKKFKGKEGAGETPAQRASTARPDAPARRPAQTTQLCER